MKVLTIIASIGATALIAGCAPKAAPDGSMASTDTNSAARSCFYVDQVRGFRSVDRTSILLDAGSNRTFLADSAGFCQDMDFAMSIAIRAESLGTSRLCTGDFARLDVRGASTGSGPCRIRIVKLLTAEEKAALEKKPS